MLYKIYYHLSLLAFYLFCIFYSGRGFDPFYINLNYTLGFPVGSAVKNPPAMQKLQETQLRSLSGEDPLEEGMASHSSMLAWRIPWIEEPGGLQSMGWQKSQTQPK